MRRKRCVPDPSVMPQVSSTPTAVVTAKKRSIVPQLGNQAGSARAHRMSHQLPNVATQRDTSVSTVAPSSRLQDEIQWIHTHLPVLRLATSNCSLQLRRQLFADTFMSHMTRALVRDRWRYWRLVCTEQKRAEQRKRSASMRLAQLFLDWSVRLIRCRFVEWTAWTCECNAQDQLAACVSIQRFVKQQQARSARRAALDQQRTLESMHVVQRALETYVRVRRRQRRVRGVRSFEAKTQSQCQLHAQLRAATLIQRVVRRFARTQRGRHLTATAATHALNDRTAHCIQRYWRSYVAWKHWTLPLLCVGYVVDQVEYQSAVTLVQRRMLGFLCRRHVHKCHNAATSLQHCWRRYCRHQRARRARQVNAASCLQRTFKRIHDCLTVRNTLQTAAWPLYLCVDELSVTDAVRVIQSAWRRHVQYATTKRALQDAAARCVQQSWRQNATLSRCRRAVDGAVHARRQQLRAGAAQCIQQCWRNYATRIAKTDGPSASVRLTRLLVAVTCIQRYTRTRQHLSRQVKLSRYKLAGVSIARYWRAYRARTRQRKGGPESACASDRGMDLAALSALLGAQAQLEAAAATRIQRMVRRRIIDRRDGKQLLKRYKILMQRDVRKREQRKIIHSFLGEREQERLKRRQQQLAGVSASGIHLNRSETQALSVAGPAPTGTATATASASSSDVPRQEGRANGWRTSSSTSLLEQPGPPDDESVQQFWSDEHQRAYAYNPRTGESVWL